VSELTLADSGDCKWLKRCSDTDRRIFGEDGNRKRDVHAEGLARAEFLQPGCGQARVKATSRAGFVETLDVALAVTPRRPPAHAPRLTIRLKRILWLRMASRQSGCMPVTETLTGAQ